MFRKIHSNRDPNDTLITELRKEFSLYFEKASKTITQKLEQKPSLDTIDWFFDTYTTRTHSSYGVRFVFTGLYRCPSSSQNDLRIRIGFVTAFASVTACQMLN